MPLPILLIFLAIFMVSSGIAVFLSKRLLFSVLFLAVSAIGSSLVFLYLSQTLVALLQLLVFVGSFSTYLVVAVAAEDREEKRISVLKFVVAAVIMAAGLSYFVYGVAPGQANENSFSQVAQVVFFDYYAPLFASVFVLFATALCSVVILKKFSKMVV